jgi:predicted XRE-type DNA-binding protein
MTTKSKKIIGGGRTVFEDIGIPMSPTDLLKAGLAAAISRSIQSRKLNQTKAAALLGIDQPRVSKLLRGRLSNFSIETLLGFLTALGHDVEIRHDPKLSGFKPETLKVLRAA